MADYRRFLGARTTEVAPYFGGPFVELADRRVRLADPVDSSGTSAVQKEVQPGYWRFEIAGRTARALERAEAPDLSHLPAVRGHYVDGYLVHDQAELLVLPPSSLPPCEEPARFTPLTARRWPTGALLGDLVDFESGAEEVVRDAFEEHFPIYDLKAIPASLRAAYSYAVLFRTAHRLGVSARPAEVWRHIAAVADEGDPAAERVVNELLAERHRQRDAAPGANELAEPVTPTWISNTERITGRGFERAAAALRAAGATVLDMRSQASDLMEVRYIFRGERFTSTVHIETLQVVDAGICLAGEDDLITLESLPSVLREAMEDDILWWD